jgi:hypothetical protein
MFYGVLMTDIANHRIIKKLTTMTTMITAALLISLLILSTTPSLYAQQDECVTGSESLVNNTAVMTAFEEMWTQITTDLASNVVSFCTLADGSATCQVNVAAYSTNVKSVCEAQNGTSVERGVALECLSTQVDLPSALAFNVFNIPICVDASCDTNNLPTQIESIYQQVLDGYLTNVEEGANLECNAETIGGDETSGGFARKSAATLVLATTTISFILF